MAQDIFLKLTGIEGESTDASHLNEIEVLTWDWSVSMGYDIKANKTI